jgi:hypothetical protein
MDEKAETHGEQLYRSRRYRVSSSVEETLTLSKVLF